MDLSIVIPCWNDAEALSRLFESAGSLRGVHEFVLADASSGGGPAAVARAAGASVVRCPRPSRGAQMNAGAAAAAGQVLLFHHADSELSQAHIDALHAVMNEPAIVGGAYYRRFDGRHPGLRWLEGVARLHNRLGGTFYGDQSIFVRADHFTRIGGYANLPLMEDVEFCRRLRRSGRVALLDPPMASSARRFSRGGAWRTTLENGILLGLFRLGVPAERLHAWYYRCREGA